jgi:ABC-2 type transport system permease protein
MLIPIFSAGLLASLASDPSKRDLFTYVNLWDHMDDFARGIVDTRHLVYYLSGTALFLFLATISLAAKKETP